MVRIVRGRGFHFESRIDPREALPARKFATCLDRRAAKQYAYASSNVLAEARYAGGPETRKSRPSRGLYGGGFTSLRCEPTVNYDSAKGRLCALRKRLHGAHL
jgi:hypothetical protein